MKRVGSALLLSIESAFPETGFRVSLLGDGVSLQ